MTRTFILGTAALLGFGSTSPVGAEEPEAIELWGDFTTHSTKDDVKAFKATQPKKKVEIIPGCIAEMGYRSKKKRLVTIIFAGLDREADCHRRLLAQLRERPDEPEVGSTTFGSVIGNGMGGSFGTITEGTVLIWRDGEKKIKLVKTPSSGYNLIFTVRPDKYIY
jgi:hypothetical protein